MKSRMKKILAILLMVSTCVTLLAGCSSKKNGTEDSDNKGGGTTKQTENDSQGTEGKKEFSYIEFSYMRPVWGEATYQAGGAYEEALFKAANVQIDVQVIPVGEYDSKALLTAGSGVGNIPDVMWANGPEKEEWREMEDQGAFYPIEKFLEKYPAVKAAIPDYIWEAVTNEDGHIYFIPHVVSADQTVLLYYRKDWFDKLGIKEPTTIAELETALETIQKKMKDVVPLTQGNSTLEWIFRDVATSFGAVVSGWSPSSDNPNVIVPSELSEANTNFRFWLQNLSKRGLLDAEAGLSSNLAFGEKKFINGKAAVIPNHTEWYQTAVLELAKNDPEAEVGIMSPLAGPDGTQGGTRAYYPVDRGFYFNGALDEATVDRIFQFLEWSLTEGSDLRYWGVEGETYSVLEDGTKIFINDADRSDDYKDTQIEPLKFIGLPEELKVVNDNAKAKFEKNGIGDLYDYWAGRIEEYNSNRFYDYKDRFVISPTYTEIGSIITETYLAPITGSVILDHNVTRERYNAAVRTWLASGGQKIIDEVNELQKDKSKPSY